MHTANLLVTKKDNLSNKKEENNEIKLIKILLNINELQIVIKLWIQRSLDMKHRVRFGLLIFFMCLDLKLGSCGSFWSDNAIFCKKKGLNSQLNYNRKKKLTNAKLFFNNSVGTGE